MLKSIGGGQFVDTETGEILVEYYGYRKPTEIIKVIDTTQRKHKSKSGKMIEHVKMRTASKQIKQWERLSLEARGMLASLLLFCNWEENLVVGDGDRFPADVPLTWKQIAEYCKVSKPTCLKIKKELENSNVFRYYLDPKTNIKTGMAINPLYVLRGDSYHQKLLKLFLKGKDIEKELTDDDESSSI